MSAGKFATALLSAALVGAPTAHAISFTSVQSPNIDISELGRVALAGNFDALSIYEWVGQEQNTYLTNGSQAVLGRFPNGAFTNVAIGDANIDAMCSYVKQDGTFGGIVVGGNFTSLGNVETQGVALFNPNTSEITPMEGLTGNVKSLFCDSNTGTVYVGGSFSALNSTNAVAWKEDWQVLPFAGFNGPVSSIVKSSDGHIVFGGNFDGLGNTTTPKEKDQQMIPLASGNISAIPSSSQSGFSDPRNIICKDGQGGSGNVWLLEDNSAGSWLAQFGFGFQPTKLRLYNTNQDGRGTKTWRFTALPDGGIMNFTHVDSNGNNITCDARCPLPQGNTSYQDFHFVNMVGMNSFRIDISEYYGSGGGLAGIELFQDDIYAYAIDSFNRPTCESSSMSAASTTTGSWAAHPSQNSSSEWLAATFAEGVAVNSSSASVVFQPNIQQSGNYTVRMYTPGCRQDGTCETRGQVNVTVAMGNSTSSASDPISTTLFQTNWFDKYDTIYSGHVDAISGSFRPSVTLTPADGQTGPLTVVAQRVRFELMSASSGGLNGLFEYNPNAATVSDDFSASVIDTAGTELSDSAGINAMVTDDTAIYIGGNFSNSNFSYIFAIRDNATVSLADGGLDSEVRTLYINGTDLYVGGNFTKTATGNTEGLNGVALYSTSDNSWSALGAGINGSVSHIVPLSVNLTSDGPEDVIALSGEITGVREFGDNRTFPVEGVALWSPSRRNWVHNLAVQAIAISGQLTSFTDVPDSDTLYAGAVSSQALEASGAVGLINSKQLGLQRYPISIEPEAASSSSLAKRSTSNQNVTGVVTGLVYEQSSLNITIIGGHFAATGSDGSEINNLLFVNTSNSNQVSGLGDQLDASATIVSLATQSADSTLWVGGRFTGNASGTSLNGLFSYSLATADFTATQPQALQRSDGDVSVNAVAPRPSSVDVYVGGEFDSAGALACPALCVYATDRGQWVTPGSGLSGTVSSMLWVTQNELILGGNLTVDDNTTSLITYTAKNSQFTTLPGSEQVPGPVDAITAANSDGTQFWVAGAASNGSAFVMLTGKNADDWISVGQDLGEGSIVRGLQVFSVSENHESSDNIDKDKVLMVLGELVLPGFGNASAVVYNGTGFQPFILSTTANNGQGSLSQVFVEKPQNVFRSSGGNLALGLVVLIALAIALALIMLLVVAGIAAERIRRAREGYVPAPTQMGDKNANMSRIPPEHILGHLDNPGGPERL
ncbi:Galactose oxidase/kelch beta-propeller [Macrophomina phaseolina MS6]|uniref:Galactose oxidase/kelch beta-propeller n=1 Tax=Macrophomina phaseolina (strain MS6) TaxID=1126212 RepID=K2RI79_MACPH|nr:Galactose oxidase/kelch beta-propeller [Macrophomina phaseolina MS6]